MGGSAIAVFLLIMEREPEIFKPVIGYEGYYEISNWGKVKSLARKWSVGIKGDTILKHGKKRVKNRYLHVTFCIDKVKKICRVNRLVALHFCNNPNNYEVVNHLDGDIYNNYYKNLEWTTCSGNTIHAYELGLRSGKKGEDNHFSKLTDDEVSKIRAMYKEGSIAQSQIAKIFGVCQTQVSRIILNKQRKQI